MRKPIIAANWKMYKTAEQAKAFCHELLAKERAEDVDTIIFAPFTSLAAVSMALAGSNIALGAQNFYPKDEGAYTGEISLEMLREFAVSYVLVGHSERREIFKENDDFVAQKLQAALKKSFKPILCVGESLDVRNSGQAHAYCLKQVKAALEDISKDDLNKIIIAYEPIWAIGSGKSATAADAEEMLKTIREYLSAQYGQNVADEMRLIYGGSVKPENIAQFMAEKNVDGALIGGASLNAESFAEMLNFQER